MSIISGATKDLANAGDQVVSAAEQAGEQLIKAAEIDLNDFLKGKKLVLTFSVSVEDK